MTWTPQHRIVSCATRSQEIHTGRRSRASLGASIVVQLFCRGWAGLLTLALAPIYVRFLGIEAYGVIGIYGTAQTLLTVLDLGLGTTLARELSRLSAQAGTAEAIQDWVRTVEAIGWAIAGILCVCLVLGAPSLASFWLRPESLDLSTHSTAFRFAALSLALQWPTSLYVNGLAGRQQQAAAGVSMAIFATLRGVGSLAVLSFLDASLEAFFTFQAAVALAYTITSRILLCRDLEQVPTRPVFRPTLLRSAWRFAAGMMGISIVTILITQTDKLVLSRILTLEAFGFYAFAATAAASVTMISMPVFGVLMPRFALLAAEDRLGTLSDLYHLSCQLLAAALVPLSLTAAVFARDILRIWTDAPLLVDNAVGAFTLMILGNAANGLMVVPYTLKIALGMSGLALKIAVGLLLALFPLTLAAAVNFGGSGAAAVWLLLNIIYLFAGSLALHRRVLETEWKKWITRDVGAVVLAPTLVVAVAANLTGTGPVGPFTIMAVWITATISSLMSGGRAVKWLRDKFRILGPIR